MFVPSLWAWLLPLHWIPVWANFCVRNKGFWLKPNLHRKLEEGLPILHMLLAVNLKAGIWSLDILLLNEKKNYAIIAKEQGISQPNVKKGHRIAHNEPIIRRYMLLTYPLLPTHLCLYLQLPLLPPWLQRWYNRWSRMPSQPFTSQVKHVHYKPAGMFT